MMHYAMCPFQIAPTGSNWVSPARRKGTVMSLIVCCGYVACWAPNEITYFLNFVGYPVDFSGWFYRFTVVLTFVNGSINPFIYAAMYREFQVGVKRLVSKVKGNPPVSQDATAT